MFKKIRKYLVVLMAVVMVASFAVIPTSAENNKYEAYIVLHDSNYVYWWMDASQWCYSTTEGWDRLCWESVTDMYGTPYAYDQDWGTGIGTSVAVVLGPSYLLGIYAEACSHSGDATFNPLP